MGRPREHDERTADVLLDAAESIAERDGLEAISVRRVAAAGETTTRAVYSLFGSKEGLVAALGARTFKLLAQGVRALPQTDDAIEDAVRVAVMVFRPLAISRPVLFRVGFQQRGDLQPSVAEAFEGERRNAFDALVARMRRLEEQSMLGGRSADEAARIFHALAEGLAAIELRSALRDTSAEAVWRDSFSVLIRGFATPRRTGASARTKQPPRPRHAKRSRPPGG